MSDCNISYQVNRLCGFLLVMWLSSLTFFSVVINIFVNIQGIILAEYQTRCCLCWFCGTKSAVVRRCRFSINYTVSTQGMGTWKEQHFNWVDKIIYTCLQQPVISLTTEFEWRNSNMITPFSKNINLDERFHFRRIQLLHWWSFWTSFRYCTCCLTHGYLIL